MRNFKFVFLPSVNNGFKFDPRTDGAELIQSWIERLNDSEDYLEIIVPANIESAKKELRNADAVYGILTPELLATCNNLEWLQAPQAAPFNPSRYYFDELVEHPVRVTNFKGIYSDHISHHIMAMVLSFSRSLNIYMQQQLKSKWQPIINSKGSTRFLPESSALIVGVGGIGAETAIHCANFGMTVYGIDSKIKDAPEGVEKMYGSESLMEIAEKVDFVISTIPHTPETKGIFNFNFFKKMKNSSFFINIGRGPTTILDDLLKALDSEEISGAGLDVFEVEPLPENHLLWKHPNVIITPHIAAYDVPYLNDRRFNIILKNCRLFAQGKDLFNVVDKKLWF